MKKIPIAAAVLLLVGLSAGRAQEGALVGTVGEVKPAAGEIIVRSPKAAELIRMGDRLYARVNGKVVIMRVTFSMLTVAKCSLEGNYKADYKKLTQGMPVYRYHAGVEKENAVEIRKPGDSKTVGGIVFVFVPGGAFTMGSQYGDEYPQHRVTVSSFWMGKYEVTRKQYSEITGIDQDGNNQADNPVERISWIAARNFCRRFSEKYGGMARFPTEAEWEYACRAGTNTKYYWGDAINGDYCWYKKNSNGQTNPVGLKLPNPWGLFDMSGNVWEWCEDWYGSYTSAAVHDPAGPPAGTTRVIRGGSWDYPGDYLHSSKRNLFSPGAWVNSVGFRVVYHEND